MSFISEKVWLQDFNSVKSNVNILSVFCKSLLPIGWEDTGREKCEALYKIYVGVTQSGDLLYLPGIQLRWGRGSRGWVWGALDTKPEIGDSRA